MIRRAPTALALSAEDIAAFDDNRLERQARLEQQRHQQQQEQQYGQALDTSADLLSSDEDIADNNDTQFTSSDEPVMEAAGIVSSPIPEKKKIPPRPGPRTVRNGPEISQPATRSTQTRTVAPSTTSRSATVDRERDRVQERETRIRGR